MCVLEEKAGIALPPGVSAGTPRWCLCLCEGVEVLDRDSHLGAGLTCWRCLGKPIPNFLGSPAPALSLKSPLSPTLDGVVGCGGGDEEGCLPLRTSGSESHERFLG